MNKWKQITVIVLIVAVVIVAVSSAFIVDETEQVVITQFGDPVRKPIIEAGIHFKIPLIQKAHYFDERFLAWDGDRNQIPTKDKRFIWVDTYARWRIVEPLLFFQRLRDELGAQSRLDDILDGETRNAIANHELVEIIRSTNREPAQSVVKLAPGELPTKLEEIKFGRDRIREDIIEAALPELRKFGIKLLDLRFKRLNYVEEVQKKIYDRMISERQRIAEKFRSEGHGEASKILGNKERELKKITSGAYKKAQEIEGKADAEATTIYARAYDKNSESREFYRFLKTMGTYEETLSEKDWLVLSTEGDFFRYLQESSGE